MRTKFREIDPTPVLVSAAIDLAIVDRTEDSVTVRDVTVWSYNERTSRVVGLAVGLQGAGIWLPTSVAMVFANRIEHVYPKLSMAVRRAIDYEGDEIAEHRV